ncbi:MAG: hypothetical protein H8E66_18685 [Planctomycetes bacterium]|nr:hypothetical protein [Planctomycetota bacterium]
MRSLLITSFLYVALLGSTNGAEQVTVVVGQGATDLEHLAAQELVSQFKQLFDANVVLTDFLPDKHQNLVLVGGPQKNKAVREVVGDSWPKLSDQGFILRSFDAGDRRGVIVAGDSPAATYWAVSELGHRFGIRYLLREDIYPDQQPLKLSGFDELMEPELKTRTWRTINDFVIGPESWGVADQKKLLRQLAKMKFNSVMLSVYPWQPFVDYEFRGVKKQTGMLWYGERFPIEAGSPGRTAFAASGEFTNPDFAGKQTYEEMTAAGIKHARGIIDEAKRLGMSVGISISPLEFPREFIKAVPGLENARGLKDLTVAPGAKLRPDDPVIKELVATKLRAYVETYPKVDRIYLTLPEFPEWEQHAAASWKQLSNRIGDGAATLESLIKTARNRSLIASGDRGEHAIKGNVVTLAFLNELLADSTVLQRADGSRVDVTITSIDPALYPVLDRVILPATSTLNFIDYTARRIVENKDLLASVPANKVRSQLITTLADDNVGILSQSTTRSMNVLVDQIRELGWDGFSTRYWMLTELDPTVHYLSRAAWDPTVTARNSHDDLFVTITGEQSIADRLWLGFGEIEAATELTDKNNIGFAFPVEGMLMKHYQGQPAPEWWEKLNEHYTQAMIEFYRSHGPADPRSQAFLFYYAKRSEYVLEYLGCVTAVRAAAIAKQDGDIDGAIEQLETAIESLYNAIDTLGDVAQDPSDRGLIATLNAYAYRPLVAEYERMLDAQ